MGFGSLGFIHWVSRAKECGFAGLGRFGFLGLLGLRVFRV